MKRLDVYPGMIVDILDGGYYAIKDRLPGYPTRYLVDTWEYVRSSLEDDAVMVREEIITEADLVSTYDNYHHSQHHKTNWKEMDDDVRF